MQKYQDSTTRGDVLVIDLNNPWIKVFLTIIGLIVLFNVVLSFYVCYKRERRSKRHRRNDKVKYNQIMSIDDEYDTTSTDIEQDGI